MTAWAWAHVIAAASGLIVASLALARGGSGPLARPLALLAIDQFAINAASAGVAVTQQPGWLWLGAVASPAFVPLALDFVLVFLGQRARWRWLLRLTYAFFGAQVLLAAVDGMTQQPLVPGGLGTFAGLLLAPSLPVVGFGLWLLGGHLRRAGSVLERARTTMLLVAVVTVTLFLVTDLLADLGLSVPPLASVGSFAFNALLTQLTLGLGLLEDARARRRSALVEALLFGCLAAVLALTLVASVGGDRGAAVTAVITAALAVAALGWLFVRSVQRARAGLERFAHLGRFSAQMAHDLKNPLAAAKGAAQYLEEELRREGHAQHEAFSALLVQQLERLDAVIERYRRLSAVEPQLAPVDLNALVQRVVALQGFAAEGRLVQTELAAPAPVARADADLVASALENLLKNAVEATPAGGRITVRTRRDGAHALLCVEDTGPGFDPRAKEQAFELFFTTRAQGSGLGLAFVREVARAHGGDAYLESQEGQGAVVTLTLPLGEGTLAA